MTELRRATQDDVPAIRDLTRLAYLKWVPIIGREPRPVTADYVAAVRDHRIDLLYENGVLAGLLATVANQDHVLIESVAVSPDFQGRGYGRQLLAYAEKIAAALGIKETKLYTHLLMVENVRLYQRLGYRVDREEAFGDWPTVYMSKILPSDRKPS